MNATQNDGPTDNLLKDMQDSYQQNLPGNPSNDAEANAEVDKVTSTNPMMEAFESDVHHGGLGIRISLFAPACLECKSLVQGAEQDFKKCHYLQGNTFCPAQYFKVDFIGERVIWDRKVAKALAIEDKLERTNAILSMVDKVRNIEADDLREALLAKLLG